jgi:hypothetical protein
VARDARSLGRPEYKPATARVNARRFHRCPGETLHGDCGIDLVAPNRAEPSENSMIVGARAREQPTMSATKIAPSFRVSLTALLPKPDHRSRAANAWCLSMQRQMKAWKQEGKPRCPPAKPTHAVQNVARSVTEQ